MYSPISGNVYCFPCVLFRDADKGIQTQFCDGFSDCKNACQRIKMHENREMHRAYMQAHITRRHAVCRLDCCLQIQFDKEKEYWIKLAFRSENENIGSQQNGNYLGILELIAQCDPFLSSHLAKYGNQGRERPSYLSSKICEEIIEIMGNQVLAVIVKELQQFKYFSLSVDSTPNKSHIDQLTVLVRYFRMLDGEVMERFLTFTLIESHTGETLATTILKFHVMSVFWTVILERINTASKSLQKETIDLQTAVNMLQLWSDFLTSQRDLFDEYEEKANEKVEAQFSNDCNRFRKRKRHNADGDAEEVVLLGKDKFRIETYLLILDKLSAELNRRMQAYGKIQSLFGFLVEFPSKTDDELKHATETFRVNYPDDIDIHFQEEMVLFKYFALAALQFEDSDDKIPASQSYKLICDNMIQSTFPNVLTTLRIYRCLMITNATGERTFSKLKILKNCHRVSMTQERLNTLAIMATENDVLQNIFQDILNDLTTVKLRQKAF